jgi:hypothetical protein
VTDKFIHAKKKASAAFVTCAKEVNQNGPKYCVIVGAADSEAAATEECQLRCGLN